MRRLWTRCCCLVWVLAFVLAWGWSLPSAAAPLHRIVAIGDLHGDFAAWRDIARAAHLVDAGGHWIGGDTVLVQTGDVVDRGPDSRKIIQDLMRLQQEARQGHGQVIALVGNHEAMNVTGDLRYLTAADYAAFTDENSAQLRERVFEANKAPIKAANLARDPTMTDEAIKQAWFAATPLGSIEHRIAWDPTGPIGSWVVGNPAIVLLDGTLFLHGGISPAYAHVPIDQINARVAAALKAKATDAAAIINDPDGPLWYRGLATADEAAAAGPSAPAAGVTNEPSVEDQLAVLLPAFGAKRIVIAHTPNLAGITISHDGRLIRIDTGNTAVFGGTLSYLDITDGNAVPHVVQRSSPPVKQGAP